MLVEPDTGQLLLVCENRGDILRVDPRDGTVVARGTTGQQPFALCANPDRTSYYVSCRRGQEINEFDARALRVTRRFPLLGDPTGLAVSADGTRLYASVHSLDQVAVLDLSTGNEIARLSAGNGPESVRLWPGSGRVYVTNLLSNPVPPQQACRNEVTVINDATGRVVERVTLDNANVGRGIDFATDFAVAAISRPKNLVPMVQVARGWVVTNGFAILSPDRDRPPVQLLIDLPNQFFSDPYDVAVTPSGDRFYISCAGADMVVSIDVSGVRAVLDDIDAGLIPRPGDHLGLSRRYVSARIPTGTNPHALALTPDGSTLYVANRLDDSVTVIDTAADRVTRTLTIGDPGPPDRLMRGERFFHSAARTFQGQFSCASCHPDNGFDGLQYDLEPDGLGRNILDNRNMRDVSGTGPFKWVGSNPDIGTQCGTRTAKWIMRTGWLNSVQVVDLTTYIQSIPPVVNPYRAPDGGLTPAQKRGKVLFDRTTTNEGRPLADGERCDFCHSGPKYTDAKTSDIGTASPTDSATEFDSAHLNNIFESAPFLHDGRSATLEQLWTDHNPEDKHGFSRDWTKQQLNDLVEYLKCL